MCQSIINNTAGETQNQNCLSTAGSISAVCDGTAVFDPRSGLVELSVCDFGGAQGESLLPEDVKEFEDNESTGASGKEEKTTSMSKARPMSLSLLKPRVRSTTSFYNLPRACALSADSPSTDHAQRH